MRPEVLKGSVDLLVLGALAHGPSHGYGVIKELRRRSGGELEVAEGTIYPALHRLERSGLLASRWSRDRRRRRVYRLTRRGQAELEVQRSLWWTFTKAVDGVLAGSSA